MNKIPTDIYLVDGKIAQLGPALAPPGGEGTVFEFPSDTSQCVKIYHSPPDIKQVRKLVLMVDNPPQDPTLSQTPPHRSIIWPQSLVFLDRARSQCIGFIMPKMALHKFRILNSYLAQVDRIRQFGGGFTWEHSLYIARNIASAMAAIHVRGYCVGDINTKNIYAADTGSVVFLDCDSFQVPDPASGTVFRCPVGTGEYSAPEILEVKNFADVDRTQASDTFALAILLFKLLMNDTPPYAARGPGVNDAPSPEDKIRKGLFPYPAGQGHIEPPPYALPFTILPPHLAALFEKCFRLGHKTPLVRPSATDWVKAFDLVIDRRQFPLRGCSSNQYHRYSNHLSSCPWCDRYSITGEDPYPRSLTTPVGTQRTWPGISPPTGQRTKGSITPPPVSSTPRATSIFGRIPSILRWSLAIGLFVGLSMWKEAHDRSQNRGTEESASQPTAKAPESPQPRASTVKPSVTIPNREADKPISSGKNSPTTDQPAVTQSVVPEQAGSDVVRDWRNGQFSFGKVLERLRQDKSRAPSPIPQEYDASANKSDLEVDKSTQLASDLLHFAEAGNEIGVELQLKNGASVYSRNKDGLTPLHLAAKLGHHKVVSLLLSKGASVNQLDRDNQTPLHHAAENGHQTVTHLLLNEKAAVNQSGDGGWTPLHRAVQKGHLNVVEKLVRNGAAVNQAKFDGATALHVATIAKHEDVAAKLLENKANVNTGDATGFTPLHYAAFSGDPNMVTLLVQNNANVNQVNKKGQTPLHIAAGMGHRDIAKILRDNGADMSISDSDGYTPLTLARKLNYPGVEELLRQAPAKGELADESVYGLNEEIRAREALNEFRQQALSESPSAREAARRKGEQERTLSLPNMRVSD